MVRSGGYGNVGPAQWVIGCRGCRYGRAVSEFVGLGVLLVGRRRCRGLPTHGQTLNAGSASRTEQTPGLASARAM